MMVPVIPYEQLLSDARASGTAVTQWLREELPYAWQEAYLQMSGRPAHILSFTHGSFDYVYDHFDTLVHTGMVSDDGVSESRLVAAVGIATANGKVRRHDDGRLRGWLGPTRDILGHGWDKGHFIAHAIGGAVDGLEANVFLQRRSVNRGPYRQMERYCAAHPGVLCFSRPIYDDGTALPAVLEFGVLKPDLTWWIERFSNR
jgi:hypothetical protein